MNQNVSNSFEKQILKCRLRNVDPFGQNALCEVFDKQLFLWSQQDSFRPLTEKYEY